MTDPDKMTKLAELLVKAMENDADPHVFTKAEVAELQAVIVFVRRLRALRWFGKWALYAVVTAGLLITNWSRIKDFFQ